MERYETLITNEYEETSESEEPVQVVTSSLIRDNVTYNNHVELKLKNTVDLSVKGAIIVIVQFNRNGDKVGSETSFEFSDLDIRKDEEFGEQESIEVSNAEGVTSFKVTVETVDFDNGMSWTIGDDYEQLYADYCASVSKEIQDEIKQGDFAKAEEDIVNAPTAVDKEALGKAIYIKKLSDADEMIKDNKLGEAKTVLDEIPDGFSGKDILVEQLYSKYIDDASKLLDDGDPERAEWTLKNVPDDFPAKQELIAGLPDYYLDMAEEEIKMNRSDLAEKTLYRVSDDNERKAEVVEHLKEVFAKKEAEKAAKIKKVKKILIIAAAVVVVLAAIYAAMSFIKASQLKNTLKTAYENGTTPVTYMYGIEANIPSEYPETDAYPLTYIVTADGMKVGLVELIYRGEGISLDELTFSDLKGTGTDLADYDTDKIEVSGKGYAGKGYKGTILNEFSTKIGGLDGVTEYISESYLIKSDESIVELNTLFNTSCYNEENASIILDNIDFSKTKTPRIESIKAKYVGPTTAGTPLDAEGIDGLTVTATYDTGIEAELYDYYIEGPDVLEADETAKLTITADDWTGEEFTDTVEIECSTKIDSIKATYKGDRSAGTVIKKGVKGLKVVVNYKDGTSEKVKDYTINKGKLKAGQTSEFIVKYGKKSTKLSVECSTLTEAQYKAKCVNRNYKDLLRNESYDKKIKIYGKVLQDCGSGLYRVSSSGAWDNVYMVRIPIFSDIKNSNLVEDDWVTVYGVTNGIYTYSTVLGASKSIPEISARYIDR